MQVRWGYNHIECKIVPIAIINITILVIRSFILHLVAYNCYENMPEFRAAKIKERKKFFVSQTTISPRKVFI